MLFTKDGVWEVSYSRLARFQECRQKAKLYAEKRGTSDKPSRNFLPGRIIDLACRTWLDNPVGNLEDLTISSFEECVSESKESDDEYLRWRNSSDPAEVFAFCSNALKNLEPILRAKVLPYPYQQAQWFRTPIKITDANGELVTINLIGEKDIRVELPEGVAVYDLKGTKDPNYYKKMIGQLVFYDLDELASTQKPTVATGFIQPAVENTFVPIEITTDMRMKLLSDIVAMYHSTQKDDFPVSKEYSPCSMCECKNACPKFSLDNLKGLFDGARK